MLAKNVLFCLILCLLMTACSQQRPIESAENSRPEKEKEQPAKKKYQLRRLNKEEAKGVRNTYEMPDIEKVQLRELHGLIEDILLSGGQVRLELHGGDLSRVKDEKELELGTHVSKVEPKVFKNGDTVTIKLVNYGMAN
jgi:hypothetical protein